MSEELGTIRNTLFEHISQYIHALSKFIVYMLHMVLVHWSVLPVETINHYHLSIINQNYCLFYYNKVQLFVVWYLTHSSFQVGPLTHQARKADNRCVAYYSQNVRFGMVSQMFDLVYQATGSFWYDTPYNRFGIASHRVWEDLVLFWHGIPHTHIGITSQWIVVVFK